MKPFTIKHFLWIFFLFWTIFNILLQYIILQCLCLYLFQSLFLKLEVICLGVINNHMEIFQRVVGVWRIYTKDICVILIPSYLGDSCLISHKEFLIRTTKIQTQYKKWQGVTGIPVLPQRDLEKPQIWHGFSYKLWLCLILQIKKPYNMWSHIPVLY